MPHSGLKPKNENDPKEEDDLRWKRVLDEGRPLMKDDPCDKHESGKCLPDQSGTSYFDYCPRLVWEEVARLVWDLIFSIFSQTSLGNACQTSLGSACQTSLGPYNFGIAPDQIFFSFVTYLTDLGPHIFIIAPDQSGKWLPDQSGTL